MGIDSQIVSAIANADKTERLRSILAREQGKAVEYAEAEEIADSLIIFFETLAASGEYHERVSNAQGIEHGSI